VGCLPKWYLRSARLSPVCHISTWKTYRRMGRHNLSRIGRNETKAQYITCIRDRQGQERVPRGMVLFRSTGCHPAPHRSSWSGNQKNTFLTPSLLISGLPDCYVLSGANPIRQAPGDRLGPCRRWHKGIQRYTKGVCMCVDELIPSSGFFFWKGDLEARVKVLRSGHDTQQTGGYGPGPNSYISRPKNCKREKRR